MKLRQACLLAVVGSFLTVRCDGGSPTQAGGEGIEAGATKGVLLGKVTESPISPVQTDETPNERPAPGVKLEIKDKSGKVSSVTTDSKGEYRISLAPGSYRVELGKSGLAISKDLPATVTISEGRETRLDIRIDTGIR